MTQWIRQRPLALAAALALLSLRLLRGFQQVFATSASPGIEKRGIAKGSAP
jgi:hypothetical protein